MRKRGEALGRGMERRPSAHARSLTSMGFLDKLKQGVRSRSRAAGRRGCADRGAPARATRSIARPARTSAGDPLKLLLAGYSGTRNTGADVRVEEMIRQFRHVLGDDNLELTITTIDPALHARATSATVRQVQLPHGVPEVPVRRGAQAPRRDRLRRLDVQEQVRERADHV